MKVKVKRKLLFGKNAKYTHWGKKGASVGMYMSGGFYFFVYGIKGLFNITIHKVWGDFVP